MTDDDLRPSRDPEDTAESDAPDPAAQAQFQHRRTRLATVFRQRYTSLVAYGRSLGSRNPADAED
ncbi:MAG TPA: hypothetical protein VNU46_07035, partial [Gemmatimonadaceae bacterium]|nr:hypothetical protein [Gemmatimonadaceae bacterium]